MRRYKLEISEMVEVDNYEHGCQPGTIQDKGITFTGKYLTLGDLMKALKEFAGDSELTVFENVIEFGQLQDTMGDVVNNHDHIYQQFKDGEVVLYSASYQCHITEVFYKDVTSEQLQELLVNQI